MGCEPVGEVRAAIRLVVEQMRVREAVSRRRERVCNEFMRAESARVVAEIRRGMRYAVGLAESP